MEADKFQDLQTASSTLRKADVVLPVKRPGVLDPEKNSVSVLV